MNEVYVIEYKKDSNLLDRLICFFTKTKYCHSAMFIDNTFYELSESNLRESKYKTDYHEKSFKDIKDFLKNHDRKNRIDVFQVPYLFDENDISKMKCWWEFKIKRELEYGYRLLFFMIFLIPLKKFMRLFYRIFKKPYEPRLVPEYMDVCSVAVDKCLKIGGYDIFPKFSERITYPGLFANRLKEFKIN